MNLPSSKIASSKQLKPITTAELADLGFELKDVPAAGGLIGVVINAQNDGIIPVDVWLSLPEPYGMSPKLASRKKCSSSARHLALDFVNEITCYNDKILGRNKEEFPRGRDNIATPPFKALPTTQRIKVSDICPQGYFVKAGACWNERVRNLAPFSSGSWRAWANAAWELLCAVSKSGRPDLNPALTEGTRMICAPRTKRDVPSQSGYKQRNPQTYPSIATSDIKEAFFLAFNKIATDISSQRPGPYR